MKAAGLHSTTLAVLNTVECVGESEGTSGARFRRLLCGRGESDARSKWQPYPHMDVCRESSRGVRHLPQHCTCATASGSQPPAFVTSVKVVSTMCGLKISTYSTLTTHCGMGRTVSAAAASSIALLISPRPCQLQPVTT